MNQCSVHASFVKNFIAQPMELKDFTDLFYQQKGISEGIKALRFCKICSSIVYLDFIVPGNNDLSIYF